jgi:hypothetical protein
MEHNEKLKLLALKFIQLVPHRANQYAMERLFAKAWLMPNEIFDALHELVKDKKIFLLRVEHGVEHYTIAPGLDEYLNSDDIIVETEAFAQEIDKSCFLQRLLRSARGVDQDQPDTHD